MSEFRQQIINNVRLFKMSIDIIIQREIDDLENALISDVDTFLEQNEWFSVLNAPIKEDDMMCNKILMCDVHSDRTNSQDDEIMSNKILMCDVHSDRSNSQDDPFISRSSSMDCNSDISSISSYDDDTESDISSISSYDDDTESDISSISSYDDDTESDISSILSYENIHILWLVCLYLYYVVVIINSP
jgi:hypothetical protein